MSLAIIVVAGWVLATGVVGVFACSLGRAAAIGDRQSHGLVEMSAAVGGRRVGPPDRREEARRRLAGSPGRRAEGLLRRDVGAADLALVEAQTLQARGKAHRARDGG